MRAAASILVSLRSFADDWNIPVHPARWPRSPCLDMTPSYYVHCTRRHSRTKSCFFGPHERDLLAETGASRTRFLLDGERLPSEDRSGISAIHTSAASTRNEVLALSGQRQSTGCLSHDEPQRALITVTLNHEQVIGRPSRFRSALCHSTAVASCGTKGASSAGTATRCWLSSSPHMVCKSATAMAGSLPTAPGTCAKRHRGIDSATSTIATLERRRAVPRAICKSTTGNGRLCAASRKPLSSGDCESISNAPSVFNQGAAPPRSLTGSR